METPELCNAGNKSSGSMDKNSGHFLILVLALLRQDQLCSWQVTPERTRENPHQVRSRAYERLKKIASPDRLQYFLYRPAASALYMN